MDSELRKISGEVEGALPKMNLTALIRKKLVPIRIGNKLKGQRAFAGSKVRIAET